MKKKSSNPGFKITTQMLVLTAIAWAIIALLFFLLFSVPLPGHGRPGWYGITTYFLENFAFLYAGILCFRNWQSPQIVSGRTVWLAFGLGISSYFVGNLLLAYWEIGLGKDPEISPGDIFFILTYLFLGWGMLLAVLSRQLNLSPIQWVVVAGIAIVGMVLAYVLTVDPGSEEEIVPTAPSAIEQTVPSPSPDATAPLSAPVITASPSDATAETAANDPAWVTAIENAMAPFVGIAASLYIIGDIILVVMATTLLLAFWGGRFSLSWRFIASASFSYYIADMWFNYAINYITNYETGALPEVFWIFSGCLFAIGAALEYDLSTRSRRGGRRRAA